MNRIGQGLVKLTRNIETLERHGYSKDVCRAALEQANHDVDVAHTLLRDWTPAGSPTLVAMSDDGNQADDEGADDSPRTPTRDNIIEVFGQTLQTKGGLSIDIPSEITKGSGGRTRAANTDWNLR
eukprot:SAG11_NODE_6702_length_1263_cov_1.052405_2_plen_125_part_00